jgi:GNAT superfamily N-acetyltransferase
MGILKEYQGKKLGSYLLKYIIQKALSLDIERLWVHTCSLDHKHALNNYLSKGLKVYKEEEVDFIL